MNFTRRKNLVFFLFCFCFLFVCFSSSSSFLFRPTSLKLSCCCVSWEEKKYCFLIGSKFRMTTHENVTLHIHASRDSFRPHLSGCFSGLFLYSIPFTIGGAPGASGKQPCWIFLTTYPNYSFNKNVYFILIWLIVYNFEKESIWNKYIKICNKKSQYRALIWCIWEIILGLVVSGYNERVTFTSISQT